MCSIAEGKCSNFGELRWGEVRRMPLPRIPKDSQGLVSELQSTLTTELRFRALLNKDDTRQWLEFVAIPGKPPLMLQGIPSVLP